MKHHSSAGAHLPPGLKVLERGWLSSNSIVFDGHEGTALVDSGYVSHAGQTLALVQHALNDRALNLLINTHLHSDHCGGNAALQAFYPGLCTLIPPGESEAVRHWDMDALSYVATGQQCPRFGLDGVLHPGTELGLGGRQWQVHAAPGHDPHSVILFEPISRCLISADALWQRGFGVVFPELDGDNAFAEVSATFDIIESLAPVVVIPGHGGAFTNVSQALDLARQRLAGFIADPHKHVQYAAKVLLKFKLLESQSMERSQLLEWAQGTPYLTELFHRLFGPISLEQGLDTLVAELVRSSAARLENGRVYNA